MTANPNKLHGAQVFTAFDMSNGFMCVPLYEEDTKYFGFSTPSFGSYELLRMPFGWVNAPANYAKLM